MTWTLLLACRQPDPTPVPAGECRGLTHTSFASGTFLEVERAGCGTLRVDGFVPTGTGAFTVTLFSSGDRVVPYVEATRDGVLDGLVAGGTFSLEGKEAAVGWGLVEVGEAGTGPVPAPVQAAWAASFGPPDGAALLVGTLGGTTSTARVDIDDDSFEVVWGSLGLPLAAGRGVYLDPLFTAIGRDPHALWADWAELAASETGTRPPATLPGGVEVPYGEGADAIAEALLTVPESELVVLGAGWPDTPGDPAALRDAIQVSGRRAGIVASPFAVRPGSVVAAEHPDWLVTTTGGEPLEVEGRWTLDPSDPAAMAWVTASLAALDGFDVVFLDDLRAVSAPGLRDDAPLGTLALQGGLDGVAAALRGVTLVAVDAPTLSVVGRVDAVRVGEGLVGDERVATLGAALPLTRFLGLDPGALHLGGPADPTGALAAVSLTGTVRLDLSGDPAPGAVRSAADLLSAGLLPAARAASTTGPWSRFDGPRHTVLVAPADAPATVDGPGGREILSGVEEPAGQRVLGPGTGEVWVQ